MKKTNINSINVSITSKCNSKCTMCDIWKLEQKDFKTEKLLELLSNFNIKNTINITGGEPFLHYDLLNLTSQINKQFPNVIIPITTNGNLTDNILIFLKHSRILSKIVLVFSIDGINNNDKQRNIKDDLKNKLSTINKVQALYPKLKKIFKFTITNLNYKEISDVYKLAKKHNSDLHIKPVESNVYYNSKHRIINFPQDVISSIKNQLNTIRLDLIFNNKIKEAFLLSKIPDYLEQNNKYINCQAIKKSAFLTPEGHLYSCLYEDKITNIQNNNYKTDISNHYEKAKKTKHCNKCISFHGLYQNIKLKKILLINPSYKPHWTNAEPMALLQIAGYLQDKGVVPKIVDLNVDNYSLHDLCTIIKNFNPDMIGFTASTRQADRAYKISSYLKSIFNDIPIIFGGVHSSIYPEETLKLGRADFVVSKEGEETIFELLTSDKPIEKIDGIYYRSGSEVLSTPQRSPIQNLDNLPIPAYNLIDLTKYKDDIHIPKYKEERALNIMTSRGCIYNCYFCISSWFHNKNMRFHSASYIYSHLKLLKEKFNINFFHFHDDDFLINPELISKLCDKIKELKIKWVCLATVNSINKNKNLLKKMHDAGCLGIEVGIESGDPNVLSKIGKADLEAIHKANSVMKESKIQPFYLMMSFAINETIDSSFYSANLLYELSTRKKLTTIVPPKQIYFFDEIMSHFTIANPGTEFFKNQDKYGKNLAESWTDHLWHEKINFLPHTFLQDMPLVINKISKLKFKQLLHSYEELFDYYSIKAFYIPRQLFSKHFKSYRKYLEFLYYFYSNLDENKTINEHIKIYKKYFPKNNSAQIISASISILSILRLVKSKLK